MSMGHNLGKVNSLQGHSKFVNKNKENVQSISQNWNAKFINLLAL